MYTISNFDANTIITLENVKEILADMGVEYTLKKHRDAIVKPSIYKDGKAYEIKGVHRYRKGVCRRSRTRMFLEGKTIQEVLDFLNEVKPETTSAGNYIQRPGLSATSYIKIDADGTASVEYKDYRPISMEAMRSLDPKRAELIDHIFYGPKKRGKVRRPSNNRVSDNCKPVYNVTTGELSHKVVAFMTAKAGNSVYSAALKAITKSCEYQTPVPEGDKPYSGCQFQWAAEMSMEKLEEILATIKGCNCKTYADYKKKLAKAEAKSLAKDFAQTVNTVNGNLSDAVALEILAQLKKLNAGMEKLTAMWE